jgi:putative ABC transport system permease protein
METLLQDMRYALRMFRHNPAFTAVAVLTLALGIGANTAIFSVVSAVLLRPLPYPAPDRIFLLTEVWRGQPGGDVSGGNYADWKAQSTAFDRVAAMQISSFNLATEGTPDRVSGERVSADFFETFRVTPLLGRFFSAEENQPGREQVVVLGEKVWRSHFAGDRSILGKAIQLNGRAATVIGILPASFDPLANDDQVWVPIAFTPERLAMHDEHFLFVFGRLKDGVSQQQAQSELNIIAKGLEQRYPEDDAERGAALMPLSSALTGGVQSPLWMLLGAVGLVLLIACANVANLQLARSRVRQREIAVRRALGATGWRLARQMLVESLVLASLGGIAGLLLAQWGVRWLVRISPAGVPRIEQTALDLPTLAFTTALAIFSGLIFGMVPARRASSRDLNAVFKDMAGTITTTVTRDRVGNGIVVTQVALALMLVVSAGLLLRSIVSAQKIQAGFDPKDILIGRVTLPRAQFDNPEKLRTGFERIAEEAARIAGVQSAAVVSTAPLRGGNSNGLIPEGRPLGITSATNSRMRLVSPDYFPTMRIELKQGRLFTLRDNMQAPKVIILNESLAHSFFPGQNPIGKRIACCEAGPNNGPMWHEVIAVVGDVRASAMEQGVLPEFYLPMRQAPAASWDWIQGSMDVVVRSSTEPATLTRELRHSVDSAIPGVPVYSIATMLDNIALNQQQARFNTLLLGLFAALALILAAIGIYGVLSYSVAQRTHEIGVRMALGASRSNVMLLVMGFGLRVTALGVAAGIAGALFATRLLASMLFGVKPLDLVSFTAGAVVLVGASLLASFIPARRATRVDPIVALRYE